MGLRVMWRILQGPAGPPGRKTAMGPDSRAGSRKGRCRETGARWLFLAWLEGIWQPPVQPSPLISLRFCFYTAFSHKQRNKSLEDWCWKACRSQTLFHPQWFQGQGRQQSHFFLRATATLSSKPSSLPTSFPRAQHLPGMQVEKKILRLSLSSPRTQGPHGLRERRGKDNEAIKSAVQTVYKY